MNSNTDDHGHDAQPSAHGAIQDRRSKPSGVLPRHMQMWLMVAIAVIILAIILFTGHPPPAPRPQAGARSAQPSLVPPDRVRSFQQELAAEVARQQEAALPPATLARGTKPATAVVPTVGDPLTDEQRRREYQSLFADNIALSHRSADRQPSAARSQFDPSGRSASSSASPQDLAMLQQLLKSGPIVPPSRAAGPPTPPAPAATVTTAAAEAAHDRTPESETAAPKQTSALPYGGSVQRLLEGTVIETVLLNRLDGTFAGPVDCLVTTPIYSHDRQSIVIPAGARVLGAAAPVQTWGDSRLAVSFHRLVMPDGRTYSLDRFKGLDPIGETGLKDSVNHHYWQVFGASLAIGALSGLAQYNSRSSVSSLNFGDEYRQAAGGSLASSTSRVLDRYLNVLPTVTIREGHRIKVYLTNDLDLPVYATTSSGGVR